MATSPSTDNYQIGKGVVSISEDDGVTWRDVGNVPVFEWTPSVDKLDHFSSREGVKTKDKSVAITVAATLKMTMDEITADNLAILVLGEVDSDTDGDHSIVSMTEDSVEVLVKFEGSNTVGLQVDFIGKVSFTPTGSFNPISDEWNTLEVTGDMVLHDDYGLGKWTVHDAEA